MSDCTTEGIRVEVETSYLSEQSRPAASRYVFAYRVRISNVGRQAAQLISRKWIITDAAGDVEVVEGPGVVGQQPLLEPGEAFEYTSFCPLGTPFGSMHGHYVMARSNGDSFTAAIAPFHLATPTALN